jgi:hypothetical protein
MSTILQFLDIVPRDYEGLDAKKQSFLVHTPTIACEYRNDIGPDIV